MQIHFYCAKCGEATKPGIPGSGYCERCRKLLRLNPAKLNDVLEVPEAAVIINGEVIGPMDRMNDWGKLKLSKFNAEMAAKEAANAD